MKKYRIRLILSYLLFLTFFFNYSISSESVIHHNLESPGYILDRALSLYFEENFTESEKMFQQYLKNNPPNEVVYRYLAEINIRKNKIEKAKEYLRKGIQLKNDSLSSLLLLGNLQVRTMEIDEAIQTYNKVLEIEEFNETALAVIAYLYSQKEMYREAIAYYKRMIIAIKKSSNASIPLASTYSSIGKLYYQVQENENATLYMKKAFDKTPSNHEIGFFLARLYNITGKFIESKKVLEIILKADPKNLEAIYLLAEINYIFNQYETRKYIALYNHYNKKPDLLFIAIEYELTGKDQKAKKTFQTILKKDADRLSAHIGLYRIFTRENNVSEILQRSFYISMLAQSYNEYNLSLAYMQDYFKLLDKLTSGKDFSKNFFLHSYSSLDWNNPETMNQYNQYEQFAINYRNSYIHYGMIMEKLNNPQISIVYYQRALYYNTQLDRWYLYKKNIGKLTSKDYEKQKKEIDDRFNQIYQNLAWTNHSIAMNRKEESLRYINHAIKINPKDPFNSFFKGFILFHQKENNNLEEPQKLFEKAISFFKEEKKEAPADYYYYLGMTSRKLGNFKKMEENLKIAIRLNPDNAGYLNYLAYMYSQDSQDLEKAKKLILKALMIEPENPAYLDSYGWIYFQMGNYKKAIQQLTLAADISYKNKENDGVIYYHLAESYYRIKDYPMAQSYYEKSLKYIKDASENLNDQYIKKQIESLRKKNHDGK